MAVVEGFLAAGTQMRLELPGKGGVTPASRLHRRARGATKDNSVVRVSLTKLPDVKGKSQKTSSRRHAYRLWRLPLH
jgi:hypothetical protein